MHNKNQLIVGFNFNHVINNLKFARVGIKLCASAVEVFSLWHTVIIVQIILPVCITEYLEMVRR